MINSSMAVSIRLIESAVVTLFVVQWKNARVFLIVERSAPNNVKRIVMIQAAFNHFRMSSREYNIIGN